MLEIEPYVEQVTNELISIGIPIRKASFEIANFTVNWGTCGEYRDGSGFQIRIAKRILKADNEKLLKKTIAHELIHTCEGCYNHKTKFLDYAKLADKNFNYDIMEFDYDFKPWEYEKTVYCPKCGTRYKMPKVSRGKCFFCHTKMVDYIVEQ